MICDAMNPLEPPARWGGYFLLGAFASILVGKVLTGMIKRARLVTEVGSDHVTFLNIWRLQLVPTTIWAGLYYARQVILSPPQSSLPQPPNFLLAIVGASQALYLAGKAWGLVVHRK